MFTNDDMLKLIFMIRIYTLIVKFSPKVYNLLQIQSQEL